MYSRPTRARTWISSPASRDPSCHGTTTDARASASRAKLIRVLILADDLSGAADCAAAFVGRARAVTVSLGPGARTPSSVLSVDLDTRSRPVKSARAVVRRAFSAQAAKRAGILFKKIDSTLRGHVAAEIAAARAVLGGARPVILAPAFPEQGRIVQGGRVIVNGVALRGNLRVELGGSGITVPDAKSDSDLDRIARDGLALRTRPLFVGSAGLARAIARTWRRVSPARGGAIRPRPVIAVVGSASPVSVRQAKSLSRSPALGQTDLLLQLEWAREPRLKDKPLLRRVGRLVARCAPRAHYVLTGGETARAVLAALGIRELRLLGEVEPGVPFGLAPGGTLVCTKAGAFGTPGTLVRCVERLKREMKGS